MMTQYGCVLSRDENYMTDVRSDIVWRGGNQIKQPSRTEIKETKDTQQSAWKLGDRCHHGPKSTLSSLSNFVSGKWNAISSEGRTVTSFISLRRKNELAS